MEQVASTWITTCWESYRLARDAMTEAMFLGTYGSPVLQAMVGQATPEAPTQRRIERDLAREAIAARSQADLEKRFEVGGLAEAVIRAIMHVRLPERTVDERGFAVLQAIRRLQPANRRRSLGEIKTMFREQYMLLRLDEERAVRAIPRLLPDDAERRAAGWKAVTDVLAASGALPAEGRRRLERMRGAVRRPGPPIDEGDGTCLRSPPAAARHEKYERLIKVAAKHPPMATAVAHPCDAASLEGAVEAARMGLLQPILVGPPARIREVAAKASLDIGAFELVDAQHSHDSAAKAVELVRAGRAEALMKGSLHTDELMGAVVARDTGIRTARRISHCFVMDVPGHSQALIISDAAVNIAPTLEVKVDIVQNAIDLARALSTEPVRVAILSAMETVNPRVPSTLEAAALCKMADRGQITGAHPRRPARPGQRHQPRRRRHQAHRLAGRRPGQRADRARSRGRQHAGQEPVVPGRRRCRRHRARRPRAHHPDQPRRLAAHAACLLCRRRPGRRRSPRQRRCRHSLRCP